jgi:hypothetical protein
VLVDWNIRKYCHCVILTSCDASFGCLCFVTVNIFGLGLAVWIRQYIILGLYDGFSESVHRHGVLEESKIASVLAYKSHNAAGAEDEFKVQHRANISHMVKNMNISVLSYVLDHYGCCTKKVNIKVFYPIKHLSSKCVTAR